MKVYKVTPQYRTDLSKSDFFSNLFVLVCLIAFLTYHIMESMP